jgi:hypothetical protein
VEKTDEVGELLREMLERHRARPVAQGARGALIAAWRSPDAEIDAAGEEGFQHAEALRDLEGAVVREHHPAGAHADAGGTRGDLAHQHLGRGAREPAAAVMLGEPVAGIAEPVGVLGEDQRLLDGLGGGAAAADRRLVEHPEDHVPFSLPPSPCLRPYDLTTSSAGVPRRAARRPRGTISE